MRPGLTRGDFRDIAQHDRVPDMELLYRAVDGLVIERGPAEKLPDPTVTGDSGVLPVVLADDDYDALDVGEGALTLTVKVARETATLDRLSGGRLTFGVGLGSDRFASEYSITGEELDDRRRRLATTRRSGGRLR